MSSKARHHKRGSAILMAVGLLVMMALLGTTFFVITHLDRKESQSLATAASIKNVATSVLDEIRSALVADLYIDGGGVIYGLPQIPDDTPEKTIDYPHENVDKWLASAQPDAGGQWRHLSNMPGSLSAAKVPVDALFLVDTDGLAYEFPPGSGRWFFGDAIPFNSGLRDRLGRVFRVAVRVVDANAFLNANIHNLPAAAEAGKVMPITDVSLERLVAGTIRQDIHKVRAYDPDSTYPNNVDPIEVYWENYVLRPLNMGPDADARHYLPFDVSDMLGLSWYGYIPSAASGRLWKVWKDLGLDNAYFAARPFLTTHSAARIMVPRPGDTAGYRADLNEASFGELFDAFYDMIPADLPNLSTDDVRRRATAAQLAANVISFRNEEQAPFVPSDAEMGAARLPGAKVYGIERQPFITEAAYRIKMTNPGPPAPLYEFNYAIELFNPYVQQINTEGWKIKVGGTTVDFPVNTMPAYDPGTPGTSGRLVLVNRTGDIVVDGTPQEVSDLDLTQEVRILRPASNGHMVVVGRMAPAYFTGGQIEIPQLAGEIKKECIRRCDNLPDAIYSLALYKKDIRDDITVAGNLGKANTGVTPTDVKVQGADPPLKPTPVYVRNDKFVNVSDLNRIFFVGPNVQEALDERLSAGPAHLVINCRLNAWGPATAADNPFGDIPDPLPPPNDAAGPYRDARIPAIPVGCFYADFFMVQSPRSDTVDNDGDGTADNDGEDVVYGQININTATELALHCLPGLDGLPDDPPDRVRTKVVKEIIAYRDLLDNTSNDGANYSDKDEFGNSIVPRSHGTVGIANLRSGPGFASPGEVAIPILLGSMQTDIVNAGYQLPRNTYPAPPPNTESHQPDNYTVCAPDDTTQDDGLSVLDADKINNDLIKYLTYYSWLSNHVTVRSDVFIAYIRVDLRNASDTESLATRKYVAVIDRGNCRGRGDRPTVLMFTHIR